MNGAQKILTVFFVILLFIIVAEVAVYFGFNNRADPQSATSSITPKTSSGESRICVPVKNDKSIVNASFLEELKNISPVGLAASTVTNKFEAKIAELDLDGGRQMIDKNKYPAAKRDYYEFVVGLKIRADDQPNTIDFYWDKDIASKIVVYQTVDNDLKPITFSDLKVGDSINLYETVDLMKKGCLGYQCMTGYKIIKI